MNKSFAAFIGLQLGGGVLGVAAWAVLSQSATDEVATGASALAVGMVIYLPLTLGLGVLLPNYFRVDAPKTSPASARASVQVIVLGAASAIICGIVAAILGLTVTSAALGLAGLVSVSATLQQVARIDSSIWKMAVGSMYNVALPGSLLLAHASGLGENARAVEVSFMLGAVGLVVAIVLYRSILRMTRGSAEPAVWRSLFVAAAPLVPHMLAFAILTQGMRIPIATSGDPGLVVAVHVVMLFVGLALAVITGFNSYFTVSVQRAAEADAERVMNQNARLYAGLGALGSISLAVAYASPVRSAFEGADELSLLQLALLSSVPPLFCAYFYGTSILLRYGHTRSLFIITVPLAMGYVLVGSIVAHGKAGFSQQLLVYSVALLLMTTLTLSLAIRHTRSAPAEWRYRGGSILAGFLPFALGLAIAVL